MAKTVEEYKRALDREKSKEQKLLGQQEMLMDRLKKEGFETVDEAIDELEKLSKKIKEMAFELKAQKQKFEETYGEFLNG